MYINTKPPTTALTIGREQLEPAGDSTYLGILISTDNGAQKDIKCRLGKA